MRDPDWHPLESVLTTKQCADLMYMGHAGNIVLYKHRYTRNYLNIHDTTGQFYRYAGGKYVEVDREWAIRHVGTLKANPRSKPVEKRQQGDLAWQRRTRPGSPGITRRDCGHSLAGNRTNRSRLAACGRQEPSGTPWLPSGVMRRFSATSSERDQRSSFKERSEPIRGMTRRRASGSTGRKSSSWNLPSCRLHRPVTSKLADTQMTRTHPFQDMCSMFTESLPARISRSKNGCDISSDPKH